MKNDGGPAFEDQDRRELSRALEALRVILPARNESSWPGLGEIPLTIPLREGNLWVEVTGIPDDFTCAEAQRVCAAISGFAARDGER